MKAMIGRMVPMVLFFWQGLSANVIVRPPLCYETRFELTNGMPKVK
jgi:hypothetical protein